MLRLGVNVSVLTFGWLFGEWSGIVVATTAVAAGVTVEAFYAGARVRPIVRRHLSHVDPSEKPLRGRAFAAFYVPLALTSVITLASQPLCSAAISRMPEALNSLAVWPIISGLLFILQSMGMAYTEVVVSMVGTPGAKAPLRRFARILGALTGAAVIVVAATPLADLWFAGFSSLEPALALLGAASLWWAFPIPAMRALQSWYQGLLVHMRQTAPVTESVVVFFIVCSAVLVIGIRADSHSGLVVAIMAYSLGRLAETSWMWLRSRSAERRLDASM
jgi:hypothetical protein